MDRKEMDEIRVVTFQSTMLPAEVSAAPVLTLIAATSIAGNRSSIYNLVRWVHAWLRLRNMTSIGATDRI
jgi:hypothetical protein